MNDLYKYLKNIPTINPNVAVSIAAKDDGADTSDATATADDIVAGKTAYGKDGKLTGTIVNISGQETYSNLLQHSLSQVKITLQAQDTGLFVGKNQNLFVTIPDYELATTVGLTADKIKEGETILGVAGTVEEGIDTSDATAAAGDITTGKTAYVNGVKITGTHTCPEPTVNAVHLGQVKPDSAAFSINPDSISTVMPNNFNFGDYALQDGDIIMFPDNPWVVAVYNTGGISIANIDKVNSFDANSQSCYVMSKAEIVNS